MVETMEDTVPVFCIGYQDSKNPPPPTPERVRFVQSLNYDMLAVPITNASFHTRVLKLISDTLTKPNSDFPESNYSYQSSQNTAPPKIPSLSPSDSDLVPNETTSQTLALTSAWIDVCSPDPLVANLSRQVLTLEASYAAFCGVTYIAIQGPIDGRANCSDGGLMQFARALQETLEVGPYIQIIVRLPMIYNGLDHVGAVGDLLNFAREEYLHSGSAGARLRDDLGSWDTWNTIRTVCKYHVRLLVGLDLPNSMPPMQIQSRWYCEPIRLLNLNASVFVPNAKSFPVLPKAYQNLIMRYMRLKIPPWLLLYDVDPLPDSASVTALPTDTPLQSITNISARNLAQFPTPAEASAAPKSSPNANMQPHLAYLRNLQTKQTPLDPISRFSVGYQDYLQAPLQPLTVNLESITYEVFEKDPIKYSWYGRAITRALHDWAEVEKPPSGPDGKVVVAVVGAGRGPLVTRALQAAEDVGVEIDCWALEKNPNAFLLLQRMNLGVWGQQVQLVKSDMRTWKGPFLSPSAFANDANSTGPTRPNYKIDILVSELLGSFADNELSPECLDGIQHLLNPNHGISIPRSYTAHFTPISTPKLHADITAQRVTNPHASETPFVVMLDAFDFLSTTASAAAAAASTSSEPARSDLSAAAHEGPIIHTAWSFTHPHPALPTPLLSNTHNARHHASSFAVPRRGVCQGLAGYFETVLYDGVELSTNPATMDAKSEGMISWFPIFFPVKTPVFVPDGGELRVNMWRCTDERKVWYEWVIEAIGPEDHQGVRRKVGGGEIQSSVKEACLM